MPHPISSTHAQVILQCTNSPYTKLRVSPIIEQADDNINLIDALTSILKQALEEYRVREVKYADYDSNYDFCKDALEQLEEDEIDTLLFINYLRPGELNTICPVKIEELIPEGLDEEDILDEFDTWVRATRERIIERYRKGELPTGRDIVFAPNGLDYQTEYSNRKPSEDEKKYLNRTHHDNFYYGEI